MTLQDHIKEFVESGRYDENVCQDFLELLESGEYIRDEGAKKHFSVYTLPYNPESGEVFIGHHRKADLWLSPGGHIDSGESPLGTLKREIKEELGLEYNPGEDERPFFLSTVDIDNPHVPQCKKHYDIWYLIETDGKDFEVDPREFIETRWATPDQARKLVTDPSVLRAISLVEQRF